MDLVVRLDERDVSPPLLDLGVVGDDGSTITVVLPRVNTDETGLRASSSHPAAFRPSLPHLFVTFGAAVLAGVAYGVVSQLLGSPVPIPSFSVRLLAAHLAWGLSLGPLTALGYRHVAT